MQPATAAERESFDREPAPRVFREFGVEYTAHVRHTTGDGWLDRELALRAAADRPATRACSGGGVRELWWDCDTLAEAVRVRDALATVPGVSVEAREV